MKSLISGIEFGENKYLVTMLVQNTSLTEQHARLIIEGKKINNRDGLEACWYVLCDYYPADHSKTGGIKLATVRASGSKSFFNENNNACYKPAYGQLEDENSPFQFMQRHDIQFKFSLKPGDQYQACFLDELTVIKLLDSIKEQLF